MYSHIKGVLQDFSDHIRLSDATPTEIVQKYLALGCNVVPTQCVYDSISSDYKWIEMRTHNPPVHTYANEKTAPIDIATFTEVIKQGYPSTIQKQVLGEFNHFVDTVILAPQGRLDQERWIEACRKDKWRDVALFLGLSYKENPKFYQLLKTITESDNVSSLHKSMVEYKPRDKQTMASDIATLIKSIQLPPSFVDALDTAPHMTPNTQSPTPLVSQTQVGPTQFKFVQSEQPNVVIPIETLRTPVMEAYRKRAGLTPIVETKRIAQQMLVAALGDSINVEDIPKAILLRSQSRIEPLKTQEEHELVSDIIQSNLISVDTLEKALLLSNQVKQITDVCNQKKWEARNLLACLVQPKDYMDERTLHRFGRIEKPKENPEFIKSLFY